MAKLGLDPSGFLDDDFDDQCYGPSPTKAAGNALRRKHNKGKIAEDITELLMGHETTDHYTNTVAQGCEKTNEPVEISENGSQDTSRQ